jgi:hypothetical protein
MLDDVLREAARTLSGQSVVHLRNDLKGVFGELWRTRCIKENPMDRVRLPRALPGKDERERLLLSDQEFSRFVSAETTPERLRVMALVMRNVGGMRTSDAHAWDWSLVDLRKFRTARVYRPKTERPKGEAPKVVTVLAELEIPKPIRAPLRAWWTSQGKPTKGPVFPIAIGQRAGERQGKRSHVRELRRALWRAGVHRPLDGFKEAFRAHKEAEARLSALRAGKARGDIRNAQRAALAALEAAQALDALQSDTEQSRATDVHSFRRAYATGLAAAGVEPRLAMALAGHRDRRTHDGYVQLAQRGTLSAPLAALPKLSTTRTVRSAKTLKVR